MSTNRRVKTTRSDIVSEESGEIISSQEIHVDIIVKDEKEFFFTFSQHMANILGLEGAEIKVLLWCSSNMQLNANTIVLTKTQKDLISEYTVKHDEKGNIIKPGLTIGSINNAISKLKTLGIFIAQGRSTFQINPEYCWKGSMTNRNRLIQVTHNYQIQNPDEKQSQ